MKDKSKVIMFCNNDNNIWVGLKFEAESLGNQIYI